MITKPSTWSQGSVRGNCKRQAKEIDLYNSFALCMHFGPIVGVRTTNSARKMRNAFLLIITTVTVKVNSFQNPGHDLTAHMISQLLIGLLDSRPVS